MGTYEKIKREIGGVPKFIWVLLAIIFIGIFFRTYNFHDWLLFKGDAFRDATLVSNVFNGDIRSLPLLGPRAGGTMLRLGPIFYDFQYVSALLFQSVSASVLAYPDLFFSILTIPVFFFFSRRFFSSSWSLAMAGMLAVSFLAIEYGRFAWNPNSTLFFTLVFSYALLRLYDTETPKQRPLLWATVAGTALSVASQLHFSAFLGLPITLMLFVLFNIKDAKKVLSYKVIAVFFVSILVVNAPIIISEFFKSGENTRFFFSAIGSKVDSHGIFQNVYQDVHMFAKYFARILFGPVDPTKILILLAGIFCGTGFLANVVLLRGEKNRAKRNFLQWTIILLGVYFLLYIPLAFKIDRPRFYLPFMMMPYLYFGYILVFLRRNIQYPRLVTVLTLFGLGIILCSNVYATTKWFIELDNAQQTATSTGEKNSKGKSFWLTWGHFERVAQVIDTSCTERDSIFFFMSKSIREYDHSIEYALLQRNLFSVVGSEKKYSHSGPIGCYYHISLPNENISKFITNEVHDVSVDAGSILVTRFYPTDMTEASVVKKDSRETVFMPEKITRNSRVYWGDVSNLIRK